MHLNGVCRHLPVYVFYSLDHLHFFRGFNNTVSRNSFRNKQKKQKKNHYNALLVLHSHTQLPNPITLI